MARRFARTCNWGTSACCSTETSTRPSTPSAISSICPAVPRNARRSGPKRLIAMAARVPDSIWSIRWPIGCPTVMLVPAIPDSSARTSAMTSASSRPLRSSWASTCETLTPCASSSSSARPVRLAVVMTPGTCNSRRSTRFPISLDSSSEVPGTLMMAIVSDPS